MVKAIVANLYQASPFHPGKIRIKGDERNVSSSVLVLDLTAVATGGGKTRE